jgi:hypothetical protein
LRHTNHQPYEDRPIPAAVLRRFHEASGEDDLVIYLTDDPEVKRRTDDLAGRADAIEFADPAFREELGYWIGQGVFGTSWLMAKIGQLAVTHINMGGSIAKQDHELLMSAPVLGLICARGDCRVSQLKAGRLYQRLSLIAAHDGIWFQPISQILQVATIKKEVASLLPQPGLAPLLPFRIGYATPEKRHTPRRAIEEVLF